MVTKANVIFCVTECQTHNLIVYSKVEIQISHYCMTTDLASDEGSIRC